MIDPSIVLQGQQPNVGGLLSQVGQLKAQQLALAGQQQIQQQRGLEMQGQQSENTLKSIGVQQAQQGQQDDLDHRAALAAATDPNTGEVNRPVLLSTLGKLNPTVAARTAATLNQQDVAAKEAQAKVQEAQMKAVVAHVDLKDQLLQGVTDQSTYTNARKMALQSGTIQPNEMPEQYDPQWVAQAHAQTLSQKNVIANQQKDREDQEKATHDAAVLANTQQNERAQRAQEQQRIGIEGARLRMEQNKNNLDQNTAVEAMAQQVANYEVKKPTVTRNNPFNQAVLSRAFEINPQLSDSGYTMTQDLRSTKPNSMGGNVTRLGTAILHGDQALAASQNLGTATGLPTAAHATYNEAATFLTGEIGQFVTGGKLTVDEGNKIQGDLDSHFQSTRDAAIKKIIDLSGGKLKAQMEQYKNATQANFPTDRVFNDPEIKGALQKHGVLQAESTSATPQTHAFSLSAWKSANPSGDVNAARAAALAKGYQVTQ